MYPVHHYQNHVHLYEFSSLGVNKYGYNIVNGYSSLVTEIPFAYNRIEY